MSELIINPVLRRTPFRWAVWAVIFATSIILTIGSLRGWIPFGIVEVIGFVSGAICVMLTVEENIWNWPLGLINNIFFIILFLDQRLYADMALQFVYIGLTALGWYRWLRGGNNHGKLKIGHINLREAAILLVLAIAATVGMTFFLKSINDAAPFLDALTTVLSLVAQYLLTRKAVENWFVWMTADVIYVGLYINRGLYLTAILYALFFLLCIGGLRLWMNRLKQNRAVENIASVAGKP